MISLYDVLKVPYQNNSWDCGVFVCRYASGIFQLRNHVFSYDELLVDGGSAIKMITHSAEFDFTLDDIACLREEMKVLIERLSAIYLPWKANRDQANRLDKLAENKAKEEANGSPDEKKNGMSEVKESGSAADEERGSSDDSESLAEIGHSEKKGNSENSRSSTKSESPEERGSGMQLLSTPKSFREGTSDVMLTDNDHDEDDSSPNSLVTQPDLDAFDNRIAKENVDTQLKRSPLYQLKSYREDNGMQYVDESSSQYRHDEDSVPSDSASV
jgi:hypothetical protein